MNPASAVHRPLAALLGGRRMIGRHLNGGLVETHRAGGRLRRADHLAAGKQTEGKNGGNYGGSQVIKHVRAACSCSFWTKSIYDEHAPV